MRFDLQHSYRVMFGNLPVLLGCFGLLMTLFLDRKVCKCLQVGVYIAI